MQGNGKGHGRGLRLGLRTLRSPQHNTYKQ